MKNSFLFLATACTMIACTSNNANYNVTGNNATQNGVAVYLFDPISQTRIDSTVIDNGTFKMKGKAEKNAFLLVNIEGNDWWFAFFNDGEPVQINVADSTLSGSALNCKLTECDKRDRNAYAEYYRTIVVEVNSVPENERIARQSEIMSLYQTALKKYSDFYIAMIEENMDNLIPVAFIERIPSMVGEYKFDQLMESGAQFTKHPYVLNFKRILEENNAKRKEAMAKVQDIVGQKFIDLEEPDADGVVHKLSEYAGNGKWVLVDFWASWCGPCKNEMPYVIDAYKKYHDKGFDIVGLSFDNDKDAWLQAITDWEMPWIHLSDMKQWKSVAQKVYTVMGIPDNILISPDGIIVARGLRGKELENKLAEIFN
ncbi:MAG: AhpC/TSA family protein [Salinivirgaceae bacterium]|nr:AhpC/TSA family protein [Salinivirgaceae bacterium]